jgi:hypothetical protein
MPTPTRERRRHERREVIKPCKIYDPASRRFGPGTTQNLSEGGARVVVQWLRPLSIGDPVDMIVGWSPRPLLPADAMARGRVARVDAVYGEVQVIAVEFEQEMSIEAAA